MQRWNTRCIGTLELVFVLGLVRATQTAYSASGRAFSFDAPVISQINPRWGAAYGTARTIVGKGFRSEAAPTILIGSDSCDGGARWVSDTSLVCSRWPVAWVLSGDIRVSIGGLQSNALGTVAGIRETEAPSRGPTAWWRAPMPSHSRPPNLPLTAGDVSVTIDGLEFAGLDATPTLWLAERPCFTSSWTSTTTIVCARDEVIAPAVSL